MKNLSFPAIIDSQLGARSGTLTLKLDYDEVTGSLYILNAAHPVSGKRTGRECIKLWHELRTAVSCFSCETTLWLKSGHIVGKVDLGRATIPLRGEKLERSADGKSAKEAAYEG